MAADEESWFFRTNIWFGNNNTWKDLENVPGGIYHPQVADLLIPFPVAFVIYIVRRIFESFIFSPIGRSIGLRDNVARKLAPNKILEEHYKSDRKPNDDALLGLAKQTDMTVRQTERWYRIRRSQSKSGILTKYNEACWRFTFYLSAFSYGVAVLWNKPYLWNTAECWLGYPHQHVPSDIFWYYMVELGFYWSLLFSQFSDVKRKDFCEMFIHHAVTILLMTMSWTVGFVRAGALILCLHDSVDYWLEGVKLCLYTKKKLAGDIGFVGFGLVWFITRLIVFPVFILRTTLFESISIIGYGGIYVIFNGLLLILQVLHVIWFALIVLMAYRTLKAGEMPDDVRSESNASDIDENASTSEVTQKAG